MTSNDLKRPQSTSNEISEKTKAVNNLKGGSVQENVEINEHYLDEILKNNDRLTLIRVIISLFIFE